MHEFEKAVLREDELGDDFSVEEWLERKHGVYGPLHDYTQDEADRRALGEDDPPLVRDF